LLYLPTRARIWWLSIDRSAAGKALGSTEEAAKTLVDPKAKGRF
jgi:hypothetical protein